MSLFTTAMVLGLFVTLLVAFSLAYRYYRKYQILRKEYRDVCQQVDSISKAYYNQYGRAYAA